MDVKGGKVMRFSSVPVFCCSAMFDSAEKNWPDFEYEYDIPGGTLP